MRLKPNTKRWQLRQGLNCLVARRILVRQSVDNPYQPLKTNGESNNENNVHSQL